MDNNNYNNNEYNNGGTLPNITTYIVLSVIELICCCRILGIVALVLSILANNDQKNGNYAGAIDKCKYAKICLIVGLVAGIIISIIYGVIGGASALSSLTY